VKTSSAKNKGRSTQKAAAKLIREIFGLEDGDVESRPMGSKGTDLMMSPRARKAIPLSVECKHTKKHPGHAEYLQAKANTKPDTIPAIVWQPHGKGESCMLITMDLHEFLILWKVRTTDAA
jgi:hypothetical protein